MRLETALLTAMIIPAGAMAASDRGVITLRAGIAKMASVETPFGTEISRGWIDPAVRTLVPNGYTAVASLPFLVRGNTSASLEVAVLPVASGSATGQLLYMVAIRDGPSMRVVHDSASPRARLRPDASYHEAQVVELPHAARDRASHPYSHPLDDEAVVAAPHGMGNAEVKHRTLA